MPDTVTVGFADKVAVITINRPQARNAVDDSAASGIAAAIDGLDARGDVSALVITGAGEAFSAGMDLRAFLAGENPLAGERIPAAPLHAAGLVNRLVPAGEALAGVR
jgi:enoyl-CoA hydratase